MDIELAFAAAAAAPGSTSAAPAGVGGFVKRDANVPLLSLLPPALRGLVVPRARVSDRGAEGGLAGASAAASEEFLVEGAWGKSKGDEGGVVSAIRSSAAAAANALLGAAGGLLNF